MTSAFVAVALPPVLSWIILIFPLAGGLASPVAGSLNYLLGSAIGGGLWAVATNYSILAILSGILVGIIQLGWKKEPPVQDSLKDLLVFVREDPWKRIFVIFGGVFGILSNVVGIYSFKLIGPVVMTGMGLIGQTIASIIFDSFGLLWTQRMPLTSKVVFSGFIVILACSLYQWAGVRDAFDFSKSRLKNQQDSIQHHSHRVLILFKFICIGSCWLFGFLSCAHSALCRKLHNRLTHFERVIFLNYAIGASVCYLIACCFNPHPTYSHLTAHEAPGFLTPLLNLYLLAVINYCPKFMSLFLCISCASAGQLAFCVIVAHYGLLGTPISKATPSTISGTVLCTFAVFILQYVRHKNRKALAISNIATPELSRTISYKKVLIRTDRSTTSPMSLSPSISLKTPASSAVVCGAVGCGVGGSTQGRFEAEHHFDRRALLSTAAVIDIKPP